MIGSGLKILRIRRNISQKDLAEMLGVSRQAISMWEADKRELRMRMLNKIAKTFGVTIDTIVELQKHELIKKGNGMGRKKKQKQKKVNFKLNAPEAKKVRLTGDFKSWDEKGILMKKSRTGEWKVGVGLEPGRYEYKFIVDDQWWTDPTNSDTQSNSLGELNSVLEVKS